MTATLTNQNRTKLTSRYSNNQTAEIAPSLREESKTTMTNRPEAKRRESFLNALMRCFSSIAC